jgi:hypothetical protein
MGAADQCRQAAKNIVDNRSPIDGRVIRVSSEDLSP